MKRAAYIIFLLLLIFLTGCAYTNDSAIQETAPIEKDFAQGRIVIGFTESIKTKSEASDLINSYGLEIIDYYETMNIAPVKVPVGKEQEYVDKLSKDPKIKWAELDYIAQIA